MDALKEYRKLQERKFNLITKYKKKENVLIELDATKRSLCRLINFIKRYILIEQNNLEDFQLDSIPGLFRMRLKITNKNFEKPKKKKTFKQIDLSGMSDEQIKKPIKNIPIKSKEGKEIRKAFIAEKGFTLISADYNQIEMRILADLADVKELKKAFKNNEDIHSLTASQVFNLDIKKVDQDT